MCCCCSCSSFCVIEIRKESKGERARGGGISKDIFTLTPLMLMHTQLKLIRFWERVERMKKNAYLPLKNHFTSLSGIFVRPHDKTIDLFSMASTVSAAIAAAVAVVVVVPVLNSSSSIASVCMVFLLKKKPPRDTEERGERERKGENWWIKK